MLNLRGDAEAAGAAFAFLSPVIGGSIEADGITLEVGGREPMRLRCRQVVNAAGLWAQPVARSIAGFPPQHIPPLHYSKGCYFAYFGRPPFQRLVYPVPDEASVGLHYTRDLAGHGRFGPDATWVDTIDYTIDGSGAVRFYNAIRKFWPGMPDHALQPGYAGIRPKIQAPGTPPVDFASEGPAVHGVPGLVHLFGIESPGLTSSLAIAEHVLTILDSSSL
jgi:L-2-hydroxyglutarate oxidase LhgO